MDRLLDYSAGTIPGAAIRAAGMQGCIRYIDDPKQGLRSKHIRPDEYQDLVNAGLTVLLVFEVDVDDALGGFAQGANNARRARVGADWIGYPKGGLIFFACDRHLASSQIPTALAYLDGAISVLGISAVGAYGFWEFIDPAIGAHASALWQCGIAPDATDLVQLWQDNNSGISVAGVSCDINHVLRPMTVDTHPVMVPVPPAEPSPPLVIPSGPVREHPMYILCQPPPMTTPLIAILSGPMFIGLDSKGEKDSAVGNIAKGAIGQWVEKATWDTLAKWSHQMVDPPKPIVPVVK